MTRKEVVGFFSVFAALAAVSACNGAKTGQAEPLETVPVVELSRYLGKWYEIARYPNSFQKDCLDSTAEYAMDGDDVSVVNSCRTKDGGTETAKGVAQVADPKTRAKLKVSFLPGFIRWTGIGRGDYWIIDLAPDYSYSVVSEPSRKYLWILSREPRLPKATLFEILRKLKAKHFDTNKLIFPRERS